MSPRTPLSLCLVSLRAVNVAGHDIAVVLCLSMVFNQTSAITQQLSAKGKKVNYIIPVTHLMPVDRIFSCTIRGAIIHLEKSAIHLLLHAQVYSLQIIGTYFCCTTWKSIKYLNFRAFFQFKCFPKKCKVKTTTLF